MNTYIILVVAGIISGSIGPGSSIEACEPVARQIVWAQALHFFETKREPDMVLEVYCADRLKRPTLGDRWIGAEPAVR